MTQHSSKLGASVDGSRRSGRDEVAVRRRRHLGLLAIVLTIVAFASVVSSASKRARSGGNARAGADARGTHGANAGASQHFVRVEDLPRVGFVRTGDLDPAPPLVPVRPVQGNELTPELIHRAEYVLRKEEAPLGTQVIVESGDHTYIARFEWHYHDDLVPDHIQGWHKGVTLYTTE